MFWEKPPIRSEQSVAVWKGKFQTPNVVAFRLTAEKFVELATHLSASLRPASTAEYLHAAMGKDSLSTVRKQHRAVCAFLDGLKDASRQTASSPAGYMFVAKCAEYDRLLDKTAHIVRANDRTEWMARGVKSDNSDVLARTIDQIAQQFQAFRQSPYPHMSYEAYADVKLKSFLPAEIVAVQQQANLPILFPMFERSLAVPGDVAEFGCFRGGLSIKLAYLLKELGADKRVYAFDTFAGFEIDDPTKEFTKEPRLGVGSYVNVLDAYADMLRLSQTLPITPVKGDATKLCTILTKPLSFVWMDLDMDVLMDPVLRQIWHLCSPDTIIGVDDVGRPTVRPWVDRLVASGAVEVIFNSDDVAPNVHIRFLKKKGPLPADAVGAWRSISESRDLGGPALVGHISQGPP